MTVTFCYSVKSSDEDTPHFSGGTSNDAEPLDKVFNGEVSTADIPTLRAMAAALGRQTSLWSEIADKLEAIQGDSGKKVTLAVWPEY